MTLSGAVERVLQVFRNRAERQARSALAQEPVWRLLEAYKERSNSTGCQYADYWCLYETVRRLKPVEVLECGTGISTLILAAALARNAKDGGPRGRLTSLEDIDQWYQLSKSLLPDELAPYVDFVLRPRCEYTWSMFRGVGYKDVPERPYTLVFIDGPGISAPSDGAKTFDFDYINVVRRSAVPVLGIIDARYSTCYAFQKILGADKVRFDPIKGLGFVGPCTKDDVRRFSHSSSRAFVTGVPFLGRFDFRIERERP